MARGWRVVREQPPANQVEQRDVDAVDRGEGCRRQDAVPAGRYHEVEGKIAERIEIALSARREVILLEPSLEPLVGHVVVIVEQVPVDVLARGDRPERAKHGRDGEDGDQGGASHGRLGRFV
jgi:hypothetical protein